MTDIADLLGPAAVRARMQAGTKKILFQGLATFASGLIAGDADDILNCLNAREKAGVTAFGAGVAIPHCRQSSLNRVRGFFVRLAEPVDYGAIDGTGVDLVFLLLSPTTTGPDHLKALAAVSRVLRDPATASKLRGARSSDALYALLTGDEARDAA